MFRAGLPRFVASVVLCSVLALLSAGSLRAAVTFETVYALPAPGSYPTGQLLKTADGTLYGSAPSGGSTGFGTVFKISPDGTFTKIADFAGVNGTYPTGHLLLGTDGRIYGTTMGGGKYDAGTFFRLTADGRIETLVIFDHLKMGYPKGPIVQGADGSFYGTGDMGGGTNLGGVWKIDPRGNLSVIAYFNGTSGSDPLGGLVKGADGNFYGTNRYNGAFAGGTFFKVTPSGTFEVLGNFGDSGSGSAPSGPLHLGADGNFYGTTEDGGENGGGTVFRVSITNLADFAGFTFPGSARPSGGLSAFPDGGTVLYGLTRYGGEGGSGTLFSIDVAAENPQITTVANFDRTNGAYPEGTLTVDAAGQLVGLAPYGGENDGGVLFRGSAALTVVAHFGEPQGCELSALTLGYDGGLYGTARRGGANNVGTFFKITTEGVFTKLHDFGNGSGFYPIVDLAASDAGLLFGVTSQGGTGSSGALFQATTTGEISTVVEIPTDLGQVAGLLRARDGTFYLTMSPSTAALGGSIYRYTAAEGFTELLNFDTTTTAGATDRLTEGADGQLYGTTNGTADGGENKAAALFRLSPEGVFTSLGEFGPASDGGLSQYPRGPLAIGPDGSFYGTAIYGGKQAIGSVFRATPEGQIETLSSMTGFNGAFPGAGVIRGPGGALYGTAPTGGDHQLGTIFRTTLGGKTTALMSFSPGTGAFPTRGLVLGADGNLWGTTRTTIFRVLTNNRPPTASPDTLELPIYNARILANDSDPDGDELSFSHVGDASHGTVTVHPDNTISYVPGESFAGTDTFTYTITDGLNGTSTTTVTILAPQDLQRASAGTYRGVLLAGGTPIGFATVQVNAKGILTASLVVAGQKLRFKARVNEEGLVEIDVPATNKWPAFSVAFTLDPASNSLTGTFQSGGDTVQIQLTRTYPDFSKQTPTPLAGRYTMLLRGASLDTVGPEGTSYATATISPTGSVRVVGKLADNTPFSAGSVLSREGQFPLYTPLYGKTGGFAGGLVTFSEKSESDCEGLIVWRKPEQKKGLYAAGFEVTLTLMGARYEAPAPNTTVAPFEANAPAVLNFAGEPLTRTVALSEKNKVTVLNAGPERTSVKVKAATGLFQGKFFSPQDGSKQTFGGVIYQKGSRPGGEGFHTETDGTAIATLLTEPQ